MGPAQVGVAIQPTQKVRYVAQIAGIVASSQYGEARAGTPLRAFFSLCQIWPNSSARHSFYRSRSGSPTAGKAANTNQLEDFGYSAWAFLLSPREGSRKQIAADTGR